MTGAHEVSTRPPRGAARPPRIVTDPDVLATVREDAAHFPGGQAGGLVHPETEADVAAVLALGRPVLAIGAQSSLTGGATPRGELVLSMGRFADITRRGDEVEVGAGVTLDALQKHLQADGCLYPPVPTYAGATVGGVVSTNAAGPATFKYGTTRDWVSALTVVLASGHVLDLRRGDVRAHADGYFDLVEGGSRVRVPVVPVARPAVPKVSAGYALSPGMDLVDLFLGAEGTLGIVTRVTLRVIDHAPATCLACVTLPRAEEARPLAEALRHEARRTWRDRDPSGIDVAAIEYMDGRSVALLREDRIDRELDVSLGPEVGAVLFVTIELPRATTNDAARRQVEDACEPDRPATPLGRFVRLVDERGLLECTEIALPADARRRAQLMELREAVPQAVNRRVALAQQHVSPALSKLAGDFIVPFDRFDEMVRACHDACGPRSLDLAVWGHLSDGNIHPNILPRRAEDLDLGRQALLEAGRVVLALGGSPLAEHGVGRNALKQQFLRMLHGPDGLRAMRAVRNGLDPAGLLSPGVLVPRQVG